MTEPTQVISASELFCRHASFVATFVRRLGASSSDVDDLVQETFLVVHRKGGFVPGTAKPTTWLAAIALRLFKNQRRASGRKATTSLNEEESQGGDPLHVLEARSSLRRVEACLQHLDPDRRAVFILFELQEESCENIARALKIPVGTVYSRLNKARKVFMSAYESRAELRLIPSNLTAENLS